MKNNPYKNLTPLERKPDGTPYRMTPAQRKRTNSLIRRECCNCENDNCIALDDGDTCTCPQMIPYIVCCKWFRWAVLPLDKALEAEINYFPKSSCFDSKKQISRQNTGLAVHCLIQSYRNILNAPHILQMGAFVSAFVPFHRLPAIFNLDSAGSPLLLLTLESLFSLLSRCASQKMKV